MGILLPLNGSFTFTLLNINQHRIFKIIKKTKAHLYMLNLLRMSKHLDVVIEIEC